MVRRQSIPTLSIPLRQQITRFSGVRSGVFQNFPYLKVN